MGPFWAIPGPPWDLWGSQGTSWDSPGALSGPSGDRRGASWGCLGNSRALPGLSWGSHGALLGLSWVLLAPLWGLLGPLVGGSLRRPFGDHQTCCFVCSILHAIERNKKGRRTSPPPPPTGPLTYHTKTPQARAVWGKKRARGILREPWAREPRGCGEQNQRHVDGRTPTR